MFEQLRYRIEDDVASIVLANPDKRNVLSRPMLVEIIEACAQARSAQVQAVILSAEGRLFSSGGDLSDPLTHAGELGSLLRDAYHPALRAIIELPMPVICAVNGRCVGGACGLALACDVVIASEDTIFDFAFARIGLVPDCGLAWLLPRIVGRNRARIILLEGRQVDARQALAIGMIDEVNSRGQLDARAKELGATLAARPPGVMQLAKALIQRSEQFTLSEALDAEVEAQEAAGRLPAFQALLGERRATARM